MITAARTFASGDAHWYYPTGESCYKLPKADGKGEKVPTLADARKLNLVPGVTTILNVLAKPGLETWKQEQAVLAALTTPKQPNEGLDDFIHRVLHKEELQLEEAKTAADLGSRIHDALAKALKLEHYDVELSPYVVPSIAVVNALGRVVWTEKNLVGDGYAGRADALIESEVLTLIDFKTAKKMPKKESWPEHRLQTAAYAKTIGNTGAKPIQTGNLYISTTDPGEVKLCLQSNWPMTYELGFKPIVHHWQWSNSFAPVQGGGA